MPERNGPLPFPSEDWPLHVWVILYHAGTGNHFYVRRSSIDSVQHLDGAQGDTTSPGSSSTVNPMMSLETAAISRTSSEVAVTMIPLASSS